MIQLDNVHVSIDDHPILHDINVTVGKGEFLGLIGPNGSGKSTLLKAIASLIPTKQGSVKINNVHVQHVQEKERAQLLSYTPQETLIGFDFIARDIVLMGRHAHGTLFQKTSEVDMDKVVWAMEQTKTAHLAHKSILNLSGGQRQLIMIAKALAQDTAFLLLDEPTSALDVYYQLHILTTLKTLCKQGKTIIVILHDLNLAARFCNKLLLLSRGTVKKHGHPDEVLTNELLYDTYGVHPNVMKNDITNRLTITPLL